MSKNWFNKKTFTPGNIVDYREVKKVSHSGYSFASKLEAALFDHLKLLERAGEISDIKLQVSVYLTEAKILYKPDFSAISTKSGEVIYFEAKGYETDIWRIKRRLWKCYGPGVLAVFKGSHTKLKMVEEIIPKS